MGKPMQTTIKVSRVADWSGWCTPCEREDRPLVLTRIGPAGPAAWLAGIGDDERCLLLTCRVCGQWQVVPLHEEDDPESVLEDDLLDAVTAFVHDARSVAQPVLTAPPAEAAGQTARIPAPRRAVPRIVTVPQADSAPPFPPEVVAAAARVLAAARQEMQRTTGPRPAALDRSRRARGGPTPPALAAVVALPSVSHSVVLATAS